MGQSNMAGRGLIGDVEPIRDQRIRTYSDGEWHPAEEPLHHDRDSAGVGLAMSFGQSLLQHEPTRPIGFVPCAVGSTAIARWLPRADLYQKAVHAAATAMGSGSLDALLWHQGEHDAQEESTAHNYATNFMRMVAGVRKDLAHPNLPVIVGGLGSFLADRPDFPFFRMVHDSLEKIPGDVPHCAFASSNGLHHKGDSLHFDARSLREFGRRYAAAYLRLTREDGTKPAET